MQGMIAVKPNCIYE